MVVRTNALKHKYAAATTTAIAGDAWPATGANPPRHQESPTKALEDAVQNGRMVMMTLPDVICLEGGVPLVRNGIHVGAIGVSGATSAEDGIVAALGAAAL